MKKRVSIDLRAQKEIAKFPKPVRAKLRSYVDILTETGQLHEPFAKKLLGQPALYEIRIKYQGAWRILYAYLDAAEVILLSAFQKKTQKTPSKELQKALKRLHEYI